MQVQAGLQEGQMRAFEHAKDPERRRLRALWLNLSFLYTRTMGPRAKRRRFQRRGLVAGPRKLGARPRAGGRDGLLAKAKARHPDSKRCVRLDAADKDSSKGLPQRPQSIAAKRGAARRAHRPQRAHLSQRHCKQRADVVDCSVEQQCCAPPSSSSQSERRRRSNARMADGS